MDGVHTQLLQVLDGPWFGKSQELARILGIGTVDGEVAMVHLVYHEVGRRLGDWALVAAPVLRVGLLHVDDGTALAVHADGFCEDASTFTAADVEGIELTHEVSLDGGCKLLFSRLLHLHGLDGFAILALLVDAYNGLCMVRCKEFERGGLRGVGHLLECLSYRGVGQQYRQ